MIELQLDKEDAALLEQVLAAYLSELRFEISNTDSFDFRSALHKQEDRIKRMLAKLNGAGTGAEPSGASGGVDR
jgi:hypothetical protein